jgi:hypothetical protein
VDEKVFDESDQLKLYGLLPPDTVNFILASVEEVQYGLTTDKVSTTNVLGSNTDTLVSIEQSD